MLSDSVAAGKDVYIEKPLTRTIEEGPHALDAVTRSGRIVQVGYQQRSYPHIREARDLVRGGEIGDYHHGEHVVVSKLPKRVGPGPNRPIHHQLAGMARKRAAQIVRPTPLPKMALVLGLRRRDADRLVFTLDRHRPVDHGG